MSKFVKIASVLFETEAERGADNAREVVLNETSKVLDNLKGHNLDLVVFSEGVEAFGQTIEEAENIQKPGEFLQMYAEFAVSEKCHVAGSVKIIEEGNVYNSVAFIDPKGDILGVYHKTYLTIGEIEAGLTPGRGAVVVESEIGRLGGAICFDLNFDDIRQQYRDLNPDIIVFPSMYHGAFMQQMWAYECKSFFISALQFHGGGVLSPLGQPLAMTDCYNNIAITTINLDRAIVHLDYNMEQFQDIKRKYGENIKIDIPADLGSALIFSQSDQVSAMDIVNEYNLELLDDYFDRAVKLNSLHSK